MKLHMGWHCLWSHSGTTCNSTEFQWVIHKTCVYGDLQFLTILVLGSIGMERIRNHCFAWSLWELWGGGYWCTSTTTHWLYLYLLHCGYWWSQWYQWTDSISNCDVRNRGIYKDERITMLSVWRFNFLKPEVQFSERTPLVYQVYLGLTPLGPTEETSSFLTTLEVSQIYYYNIANKLYTEIFFSFMGVYSGNFLVYLQQPQWSLHFYRYFPHCLTILSA